MKNIHPRLVDRMNAQLSMGTVITGAVSASEDTAIVFVKTGAQKNQFNLPKADIAARYPQAATTLTVDAGVTYNEVVDQLSARDNLYLILGVDVEPSDEVIEFDVNGRGEASLAILPDSIIHKGSIKLNLVLRDKVLAVNTKSFALPLQYEKIALALVRKVFTVKGNVFTGNQLTKVFCQAVISYLTSFKFDLYSDALKQMQQGQVLDVVNDGVSDIVVFRTLGGVTYLIRFQTHEDDAPVL